MSPIKDPLSGLFFLSFTIGEGGKKCTHWQGKILAPIGAQNYLVQLYSWLDGHATNQAIVTLEEMTGWKIYSTEEERNEAYRSSSE